jgi:hypothetical protein
VGYTIGTPGVLPREEFGREAIPDLIVAKPTFRMLLSREPYGRPQNSTPRCGLGGQGSTVRPRQSVKLVCPLFINKIEIKRFELRAEVVLTTDKGIEFRHQRQNRTPRTLSSRDGVTRGRTELLRTAGNVGLLA